MISVVAEHSVDLDLLPKESLILDLGCLGFEFTKKIRELGHIVYPVDIEFFPDKILDKEYYRVAITGYNGRVGIQRFNDKQATRVEEGDEIDSLTLWGFINKHIGHKCDFIKMDIEGSEYDVIMALDKPPATQFSIEFHLHTGAYSMEQMRAMEKKLEELGYKPVQHVYESRHCAGLNYWDSLFILK